MMAASLGNRILAGVIIVLAGGLTACNSPEKAGATEPERTDASPVAASQPRVTPPSLADTAPRDYPGLHNVVTYHDNFYSGSAPDGDNGFDTLSAMGIKTIISVDGAAPDVETAHAHGLHYIHLPIGYNGFDESRRLELVRAARDALAQGPVYVHCHHGKHRSAGAAGAIAANMGWASPEEMVARMKVSGTAPAYKGLYSCTANSTVLGADVIDAVPANFPEVAPPVGFVKGMVEIDEITDHLKLIEKAGWTVPPNHPDLVPVAEAGRLTDHFRIQATSERAAREPAGFGEMLRQSQADTQLLEDMLGAPQRDAAKLSAQFKLVTKACTDCHAKYRD